MSVSISAPKRVFEICGMVIEDPAPELELAKAVRQLALQYPLLRHTQVFEEDAVFDGERVVYRIIPPPVKDNG